MKIDTSARLKQLMNERNLKQVDVLRMSDLLQKELGVKMGKSTLSQYVNGIQSPDQDRIYLLSRLFDVNEPWLMGYDVDKARIPDSQRGNRDVKNDITTIYNELSEGRQEKVFHFAERQLGEQKNKVVPLVGQAAANPTELSYGDTEQGKTVETNVPSSADCAIVIKGNSMEPLISDGEIVFYRSQPDIENGEIAIVEIEGNGVTCKQVYFNYEEELVILKSLNEKYEDRELTPDDVRILGKVLM